jgi:phenylacetate-CoA ligase
MFTVFDEKLAVAAREIRDRHQAYANGGWDAATLGAHQLAQLRRTIEYVSQNSPFYRRHLADVALARLVDLDSARLAEIPFTTKDDMRSAQHDLLSRPLSRAWIYYETTGTTGASTPCPRDNIDSLNNNTILTLYYETVLRQFEHEQVIGVAGPTELHAFGDTFGDVCRNLGLAVAKMWPQSPMVGFDRALTSMRTLPITGLFCTPGTALTLAKKAVAAGLDPRRDFPLEVLMLTGELASPQLLANIGHLWGARAYNALYASQEASVLGAAGADGGLYTAPSMNLYEVVDPWTGVAVPVDATGTRRGELVVTSLYQGMKPLVRYRTGDLVRLSEPRPGATLPAPTLDVLGRTRDELIINEQPITGYDLENILLDGIRGYLDYQVVIDAVDGVDHLTLELESPAGAAPTLPEDATARRAELLGAEVTITAGTLGAITTTGAMVSWKAARVVDRRGSAPDEEKVVAGQLASSRS